MIENTWCTEILLAPCMSGIPFKELKAHQCGAVFMQRMTNRKIVRQPLQQSVKLHYAVTFQMLHCIITFEEKC